MKKPPKKKRIPPRRKPLKRRWVEVLEFKLPGLAELDRLEARDRAMLERMPPEVRQEWDRLMALPLPEDGELDPADQARVREIQDQYRTLVSEEEIARHTADIVCERDAKGTVSEP